MTPIEKFFDRIFVVNLVRRTDRRAQAEDTLKRIGIYPAHVTWFDAYDKPISNGQPNGNMGCTTSHAALLHIIAHEKIPRVLILEDDFDVAFTGPDRKRKVDPQALFDSFIPEIEAVNWDMLYLGRHFANMPKARVSPHLVKIGRMLTTSSYAVTWQFARRAAPYVYGVGPIDNCYFQFHDEGNCYCVDPTLFIQRPSVSDLRDKHEDYVGAMQDIHHLQELDAGRIYP